MRRFGGYSVHKLVLVPIADIDVPPIWKPVRAASVREAMDADRPLPPVRLGRLEGSSRWQIGDGIHRTNVSIERGFSHVPALVEEWVETPEARVPEEPEKPQLRVGAWVKLRAKAARAYGNGRVYGWIWEQLGGRGLYGTKRWFYNVALVKRGDTWPNAYDLGDTEFDPVPAPPWAVKTKREIEEAS